jgi:hypothetical protein
VSHLPPVSPRCPELFRRWAARRCDRLTFDRVVRRRWRLIPEAVLAAFAMALPVRPVAAQVGFTSAIPTVALSATRSTALSIFIVSGGTQTLASVTDNTVNTFAAPVRITASWKVSRVLTSEVRMLAYFNTPAQALANGTNYLASSRVKGRILTTPITTWQPTTWVAFTQNASRGVGVNGGTLRIFRIPITSANATSSRTFDLEFQLDLVGQPALTAGTYTGTVTVRAFTT